MTKLLFIYNDSLIKLTMNPDAGIQRRTVELELTEEQIEKAGRQKIGCNCGNDFYETVESVSILREGNEEIVNV